jgi:hypothetical protein
MQEQFANYKVLNLVISTWDYTDNCIYVALSRVKIMTGLFIQSQLHYSKMLGYVKRCSDFHAKPTGKHTFARRRDPLITKIVKNSIKFVVCNSHNRVEILKVTIRTSPFFNEFCFNDYKH